MTDQGIKIVERDGVIHLSGDLNEYADFSSLLRRPAPLRINMKSVNRLNSIGIRNLLKFISDWGDREFVFEYCPSEFIDQINMIPALLGTKDQGSVASFYVPYECAACERETEVLAQTAEFQDVAAGGEAPTKTCPNCGGAMTILTDSFFVFLERG